MAWLWLCVLERVLVTGMIGTGEWEIGDWIPVVRFEAVRVCYCV
jgi:hypothetical protein